MNDAVIATQATVICSAAILRPMNKTSSGIRIGRPCETTIVRNRELTSGFTSSSSRFQVAAIKAANRKGAHQVTSVHLAPVRDVNGAIKNITSEMLATRKR